mgnify:CR=1 FL=1
MQGESDTYVGKIDPVTMLSIIRVQNEQKYFDSSLLDDPMPDVQKRQDEKERKKRKHEKKEKKRNKEEKKIRNKEEKSTLARDQAELIK